MSEPDDPSQKQPETLDYRSPRDEPQASHPYLQFAGGLLLGVIAVAIVGAVTSIGAMGQRQDGFQYLVSFLFATVGLGRLIYCVLRLRTPTRTYFVSGFTCGVGICCLIEGFCFAVA